MTEADFTTELIVISFNLKWNLVLIWNLLDLESETRHFCLVTLLQEFQGLQIGVLFTIHNFLCQEFESCYVVHTIRLLARKNPWQAGLVSFSSPLWYEPLDIWTRRRCCCRSSIKFSPTAWVQTVHRIFILMLERCRTLKFVGSTYSVCRALSLALLRCHRLIPGL